MNLQRLDFRRDDEGAVFLAPDNLGRYVRFEEVEAYVNARIAALDGVALARNPRATSREAARGVLPRSGSRSAAIYAWIVARGGYGATDHEIEQHFGLLHQSASATRNTLMNRGLVTASGHVRRTASGYPAIAWMATPASKEADDRQPDPVPIPVTHAAAGRSGDFGTFPYDGAG
jgi:hypothetical protein